MAPYYMSAGDAVNLLLQETLYLVSEGSESACADESAVCLRYLSLNQGVCVWLHGSNAARQSHS